MTDEWIFDPQELTFYFPDVSVPDLLDFGRTQVGRPRMKRFAIENVGFDDLKIYARSGLPFGVDPRLGDPAEDPLVIPAPGMDDIVVSFDPAGEGTANGILRLETNDPDEPWVDVRLTGQATYEDVGEYTDPDDCQGNECSPGYAVTGCGCRTSGAGASGWTTALLLGLAAAWNRLRRRRDS
jgi:MYXO-CTERM domain-containing protein